MSTDRFSTGKFEVNIDPDTFLIPKRTGTSVHTPFDGQQAVILLSVTSIGYASQTEHAHMYALNHEMACGIITQLTQAMCDAGVSQQQQLDLLTEAIGCLDAARRRN